VFTPYRGNANLASSHPCVTAFRLRVAGLWHLETKKGNLVRHVNLIIVGVLYLNSVADHEIAE